ncbi:MAG: hypothetical protein Q7K42_05710, partial [Candidatus Diapherotrites archaeon]|nr:hypothetical protein [Candidatus Diapherotrites archaeon]
MPIERRRNLTDRIADRIHRRIPWVSKSAVRSMALPEEKILEEFLSRNTPLERKNELLNKFK